MTIAENLREGLACIRAGRKEEAEAAFQAVLDQDPTNETALLWKGYLAADPKVSLVHVSRALESHPRSPRAYGALEWAWQRLANSALESQVESHVEVEKASTPMTKPPRTTPALARHRSVFWQGARQMVTRVPALTVILLIVALIGCGIGFPVLAEPSSMAVWASAFTTASPLVTVEPPSPTARVASVSMPVTVSPAPTRSPETLASATNTPSPTPAVTPTPSPSPTPVSPSLLVPDSFPTPAPHQYVPSTTLLYPTPVMPVPVSSDAINIAVLGSDQRPDWSEWHTDVVQIVSIQRSSGAVSVISVPRDLYVYIPSLWMSRINFADFYGDAYDYEGGGPTLFRDTVLYNLGIRVDHYVRTNFDGLIDIVDTVGGVDIPVHCRLSDYWPYPDENGVYPILTMEPGIQHMDGETALWYARSRKTTSVFSRERRQQQVLQALWHKARDAGLLSQVPTLWKESRDMIQTDLTLTDILNLAQLAMTLDDRNVRFYNIGADQVTPWTTPYGGAVFLPRWEKIQPIVAEAMSPPPEARLNRTYLPIEVWNGTSNEGWGWLAVDRLYRAGFPAEIGETDRQDYAETQLIVFSERVKGSGVGYIKETFNVADSQVIHQPGGSTEFGFRLIVGADYQTCPYLD